MTKIISSSLLILCILASPQALANPPELFIAHLVSRAKTHLKDSALLNNYLASQDNFNIDCWSIYTDLFDSENYDDDATLSSSDEEDDNENLDEVLSNYLTARVTIDLDEMLINLETTHKINLESKAWNFLHAESCEATKANFIHIFMHELIANKEVSLVDILLNHCMTIKKTKQLSAKNLTNLAKLYQALISTTYTS